MARIGDTITFARECRRGVSERRDNVANHWKSERNSGSVPSHIPGEFHDEQNSRGIL